MADKKFLFGADIVCQYQNAFRGQEVENQGSEMKSVKQLIEEANSRVNTISAQEALGLMNHAWTTFVRSCCMNGGLSMSRRVGLFLFFLCLSFAPCASADTLFLSCTPTVTLNGPDMLDACPAAGLSPGSKVTAIKLYLLADFQGGAPEVRDLIHVVFLPRMVKKSVLIENTRDLESPHSAR